MHLSTTDYEFPNNPKVQSGARELNMQKVGVYLPLLCHVVVVHLVFVV